jgi:ribosomal protein S18 acetylase RimI-like enzyme
MPILRLRDAKQDDLEICFAIAEGAMRAHIEKIHGTWDSAEERRKHLATFTPLTHKMVLVEEAVAGLVATEEFPTYIWLVKLYLLPQYRGHGVGSNVLQDLLARAHAQGKQVTLQVLKVNHRAQALYARHGFKVTHERLETLFMATGA